MNDCGSVPGSLATVPVNQTETCPHFKKQKKEKHRINTGTKNQ